MEYFFIFFLGAIIGSFLNVVILRLPKEETLKGRSHCVSCKRELSAFEMVPFFSFLFLGAKCSKCGKKISWRYFIIEAITGILFLCAFIFSQQTASAAGYILLLRNLIIISVLICVFVIDLENFLILDSITYTGLGMVLLLTFLANLAYLNFSQSLGLAAKSLAVGILTALPFYALWFFSKGKWIGFGDVKLALFLAVIFGWPLEIVGFLLAFLIGGVVSCFLLVLSKKTLKSAIPLGTFLSFGAVITLFFGQKILFWYLSLMGF
jgi:leader peptidase (prepilin peptidase) / N-methyltransferase